MFERKYTIKDGKIVKRSNEVPIPEDEPLFFFRAKDCKALAALVAYSLILNSLEQKEEVMKSINDFRKFAAKNPDKMVEPTP